MNIDSNLNWQKSGLLTGSSIKCTVNKRINFAGYTVSEECFEECTHAKNARQNVSCDFKP